MRPAPGQAVRIETTKWGDRPHWRMTGVHLGADEHGDWVGVPRGTHHARPGAAFVSEVDTVTLLPVATAQWWVATFHAPGTWASVYVDITTPPHWLAGPDGPVVTAVDLDLDVVRRADGSDYVDDEDEFAEHRVCYAYPPEVVAAARASCDAVHAAVAARRAPYDGSAEVWLERLAQPG